MQISQSSLFSFQFLLAMSVNKTILKEATDYKPELTYDDHIRAPNVSLSYHQSVHSLVY